MLLVIRASRYDLHQKKRASSVFKGREGKGTTIDNYNAIAFITKEVNLLVPKNSSGTISVIF